MAKTKIPKKVLGYKVPKTIRKSPLVNALLASEIGRGVLANVLTAGAGAAAAVLVSEREEIVDATEKGARKSARAANIAGEAIRSAAQAATEVVREAADSALPKKWRKNAKQRRKAKGLRGGPRQGAVVH